MRALLLWKASSLQPGSRSVTFLLLGCWRSSMPTVCPCPGIGARMLIRSAQSRRAPGPAPSSRSCPRRTALGRIDFVARDRRPLGDVARVPPRCPNCAKRLDDGRPAIRNRSAGSAASRPAVSSGSSRSSEGIVLILALHRRPSAARLSFFFSFFRRGHRIRVDDLRLRTRRLLLDGNEKDRAPSRAPRALGGRRPPAWRRAAPGVRSSFRRCFLDALRLERQLLLLVRVGHPPRHGHRALQAARQGPTARRSPLRADESPS